MNAVLVNTGRGTGMVLGLVLATAAYGQAPTPVPLPAKATLPQPRPVLVEKPKTDETPKGSVHRMEIVNGSGGLSVRYFGKDLAPTELSALRDLERAENEANFTVNMSTLRNLYLRDEMQMEGQRHRVQMVQYGTTTQSTFGSPLGGFAGGPYMGATGIPNNFALVQNPFYGSAGIFPGQYANSPLYPNVYTPGYWGDSGIGASTTVVSGLQNGMGDEGVMKREIARGMAAGYTPESMAVAAHSLENAMARVAGSAKLREGIRLAGIPPEPVAVTLTLKDGKEMKGNLLREDADWYHVQTDNEDVSIRKSEVTKSVRARPK